jgi:NAD(P)H-dependent nitrite reductase small subunit
MDRWITVATEGELASGQSREVELGECVLALWNVDGEHLAIDGACPHQGGPLAQGMLDRRGVVTCPWHAWRFNLRDGVSPKDPRLRVQCYPVRVVDGEVQVRVATDGS